MTIAETLLPEFDKEMQSTRKLLACVPDTRMSWKPHEKSMTLGRLAGHVAELPSWAVNAIKLDSLDLTPGGKQIFKSFVASSQKELLEVFDRNVPEARAAIAGASDAHLDKIWSLIFGGKTVLSMSRAAVLRSMVMNHLIHHRAQLGVYLRLSNVAIPDMYGPSADEVGMFAA